MTNPVYSRRMQRPAFTLIELLVVIAIISLLAAILFPVFAQAREKARSATCQSNLKQVGIGILQYTQDYDEMLPHEVETDIVAADAFCWGAPYWYYFNSGALGWMDLTYPYTKSQAVYRCPDLSLPAVSGFDDSYGYAPNDYVLPPIYAQGRINGYPTCTPKSSGGIPWAPFTRGLATITRPSEIVMMGERGYPARFSLYFDVYTGGGPNATYPDPAHIYLNTPKTGTQDGVGASSVGYHHNQMCNFLYCDGHVKSAPYSVAMLQNSFGSDMAGFDIGGNW